jgi:SNF2 family DNA or RNA helicase
MIAAALDGGRIVIEARSAPLALCRRIPGGRYDPTRRSWSYPATAKIADQLLREIPELCDVPGLRDLLDAVPAKQKRVASKAEPMSAVKPQMVPEIPIGLRTALWRHQRLALQFTLEAFERHYGAAMLAMRMGTGKSLVALMTIVVSKSKLVIIICPRRVINTWVKQFSDHWAEKIVIAALDDSLGTVADRTEFAESKRRLAETLDVPFVAIINFEASFRPAFSAWALKQNWDLGIVDESHRAKAPGGKASLFLKALRNHTTRRLMLTGTPMPHSPLDIYAQARFLDPRIYGTSFAAFRARYAIMGGFKDKQVVNYQNLDELKAKLHSLCFRVEANVLDLPPAVEVDYECELSDKALIAYNQLEEHLITEIDKGVVTAANAMVLLLRLQQITGGALKADNSDRYDRIDTAKIDMLTDIFEDLGPDEPWIVFCRFHADLDAVHQAAAAAAVSFERMDYLSLELSGRKDDLERWQNGQGIGLAVQTSAGGVGVDLTRAAYSIFYSLSFSLGEYDQALARTVRPGQKRSVTHIHLLVKGSVDRRIRRALARRAQVIESVLDELQGLKETRSK